MLFIYFWTVYKLITNTNVCKDNIPTCSGLGADNKDDIATSCQQTLLIGYLRVVPKVMSNNFL